MQWNLDGTTCLSAPRYARSKTPQEKADDWAYTINHAISCGLTDVFIQPPVAAWVQTHAPDWGWFRWLTHLFEDHNHHGCTQDHPHGHAAAASPGVRAYWAHLKHWYQGEFIADAVAVPLTMTVQRLAPGLMHGLRRIIEPWVGRFFRAGAEKSARDWAAQQSISVDAPEAKAKAAQFYEHEVSHLPQALVWNAFSIPINIGTMMYLNRSEPNKGALLLKLLLGKSFGSAVSNGALIGGRALHPELFRRWDTLQTTHVILPVSRAIDRMLGTHTAFDTPKPRIHAPAQFTEQGVLPALPMQRGIDANPSLA